MPEMYGVVWQDVRAARLKKFRYVIYYVAFADRVENMVGEIGDRGCTVGQGIDGADQVCLHLGRIDPGGLAQNLEIGPGAVVKRLDEMDQFDIGVAAPFGGLAGGRQCLETQHRPI